MSETQLPREINVLVRISKEKADDMFEALPPIFGNNCWAMGEPYSSNDAGKPRFFWVQKRGNLFVCCLGTRIEAQEAFKLPTPAQV